MIRVTIRRFSQLSKGDSHSFAIKEGKLYGWGMNNFGQLGFKNTKEWTEEMREPVGQLPPMKSVSAGVYIYRIHAGDFVDNRKMILLK